MPKGESPLNPAEGPVVAFACKLRALRALSGLTYRQISKAAHYSHVVFVKAASGRSLPSWPVTREFVLACGATKDALETWRRDWEAVQTDSPATLTVVPSTPDHASPAASSDDIEVTTSEAHSPHHAEARPTESRRSAVTPWHSRTAPPVPDPDQVRTPSDFAKALATVRGWTGVSYRQLARQADIPSTTIHDMCQTNRRRFHDWQPVAQLLEACGVPETDMHVWRRVFGQLEDLATQRTQVSQSEKPNAVLPVGESRFTDVDQAQSAGTTAASRSSRSTWVTAALVLMVLFVALIAFLWLG